MISVMLSIHALIRPPRDGRISSSPFASGTIPFGQRWNSVALFGLRGELLVGISQREVTGFYPSLLDKKHDLEALILEFFINNVRLRFESEDYTFDVYVTNDGRVKLVDFNPWGAFTLPLLFTWEELDQRFREEGDWSGWDQFLRHADEELRRQARSFEAGA
ncbi:hypothetical protein HHK36_023307 [Tetracentron sinense]|uniref:Cell division cycle protein 123 n=1 Tax=Tetracentron sinense TaxID=13715 RepID=A0A835D7S9_TETSI|nr:hypothetical protein HHK36_023307 [Tetracentron sinense]